MLQRKKLLPLLMIGVTFHLFLQVLQIQLVVRPTVLYLISIVALISDLQLLLKLYLHLFVVRLFVSNVRNHNQNVRRMIMRNSAFRFCMRMRNSIKTPKCLHKSVLLHILRNHAKP